MASAIATVQPNGQGVYQDGITITLQVSYGGPDTGGNDVAEVQVNGIALQTSMSDAVIADAESRGYALAAGDILLPLFTRG
jgi:hypothetical protein